MSSFVVAVALTAFSVVPLPDLAGAVKVVRSEVRLTVIKLASVDATRAAEKLTALLGKGGDVVIVTDQTVNVVILQASAERIWQARAFLQRLDEEARWTGQYVIPLKYANAVEAAKALKAFLGDEGSVVAEARTNTIILYASAGKVQQARKLLERLDGKGK